jgi:WhiB family transcriptional regulator, redox-sensing transcriptional regulator
VSWAERAACRDIPVGEFFKEAGGRRGQGMPLDEKRAKRICALCPVRRECLGYALAVERIPNILPLPDGTETRFMVESAGIWGGTTQAERRELRHYPNCSNRKRCAGCIPVKDIVDALDISFRVQVRGAGLIGPGEEIAV